MANATDQRQLVLFELLAGPTAVAEPPAGHLRLDLLDGDLHAGRQALDDRDQGLAMGFAGGQEAEHPSEVTGRNRSRRRSPAGSPVRTPSEFGLGGRPQQRRVGAAAGPELLLEHGLVDQHPEPVDRLRTGVTRRSEQRRLERVVHDVGDGLAGAERTGSNGQVVRTHAD